MKATKLLSTALATGALFTAAIAPANAATLYDNSNYSGYLGTWNTGTGWVGNAANDKASSIAINGRATRIYADINNTGPTMLLTRDYNDLSIINTGLAWWQTWDNRITSLSK